MEILEMFIDERDDTSGIDAISVVDSPAIELDFIALNENKKVELVEVDKEKRILMGAILVPNKPIYRNQDGKEFYIYFTPATVRKGMELFFKKGNQSNATEMHEGKLQGCTLVESWIKEDDVHDKSVKYGLQAPIGTWLGSMKIEDEETYQKAKRGELKGFSIEGFFTDKLVMTKNENTTDSNNKSLLNMTGLLKTLMEKVLSKKPKTETAEIKLEQYKSADETVVFEADKFEAGNSVFFISEEDRIPVPIGEYELENGMTLTVTEEGLIDSMGGGEQPTEEVAPEEEQEMEGESTTAKKIVESVTKETHFEAEVKPEVLEVEFTDAQKATLKTMFLEWVAEEESKEVEVLAEEVTPIKHSPEKLSKSVKPQKAVSAMTQKERISHYMFNN